MFFLDNLIVLINCRYCPRLLALGITTFEQFKSDIFNAISDIFNAIGDIFNG